MKEYGVDFAIDDEATILASVLSERNPAGIPELVKQCRQVHRVAEKAVLGRLLFTSRTARVNFRDITLDKKGRLRIETHIEAR